MALEACWQKAGGSEACCPDSRSGARVSRTFTISSPLTCRSRPRMSMILSGKAFHLSRARRSTGKQARRTVSPGSAEDEECPGPPGC